MSEPGARIVGENPPYGADVNFYSPAADPHASISITDAGGMAIRRLMVNAKPGINRVWWDLRTENGRMPHMLVPPPDATWVQNGPKGYHILTGIMIPSEVRGAFVLPGTYKIQLVTGGRTLSAPLTVLADPHSLGTHAALRAEWDFETRLLDEIDQTSDMIEHLEWTRQQLASLDARYGSNAAERPVVDAANELAGKAIEIEGKLMDIHLTDGNEDLNRHPSELYQKLTALYD